MSFWEIRDLLRGRLKLIEAADSDAKPEELLELFKRATEHCRNAWEKVLPAPEASTGEPSFLRCLPAGGWDQAFRRLERQIHSDTPGPDWDDPLLLMIGETIAYLLGGDSALKREGSPVFTWVLLKSLNRLRSNDDVVVPEGVLARLVVEKVPEGAGYLYPDCRYNGYLPLEPSFQEGLRNVMTVLRRRSEWIERAGQKFDFRWRLIPTSPVDGHGRPVLLDSITGRSAEAAFACAILAALMGERLDERSAITACFAEPGAAHEKLQRVEGIVDKLLGTREEQGESQLGGKAKENFLDHILVSDDQPHTRENVQIHNWTIEFHRVKTLNNAYRLLSRQSQITDAYRQRMSERSRGLLEYLCHPYVRPRLVRYEEFINEHGERTRKKVSLKAEEVRSLFEGRHPRCPASDRRRPAKRSPPTIRTPAGICPGHRCPCCHRPGTGVQ